ncbi:hypothetical protein [Treponema sp.]|uniref:hypothetical protein n=1 Tax=Treponema sp. TaxID=166 RepID=UPI003F06AB31
MLLNIQIERLELSQAEKTIDVDFLSKGVRFDVYVKDGTKKKCKENENKKYS